MAESFRQASKRQLDSVLVKLLVTTLSSDIRVEDYAIRGLASSTPALRHQAALWCIYHRNTIDEKALKDARKTIRKWAANPDGSPGDQSVYALMEFATREDIPLIRRLMKSYKERFRSTHHPKYGCRTVSLSGRGTPIKYADLAWLLCRLGDSTALHEVAEAITQKDDPEKRAWAILLAAGLWPKGFYSTAIANALSDDTVVQVPAVVGPPPGVSLPVANFVSLQRFTRVCDVAVRALFDMEPPGKAAPFEAPTAKSWILDGLSAKKLNKIADDGYHRSMAGAITIRHVVGFPPDRLKWAREYARKCQENRIRRSQSNIAPKIVFFGVDGRLAKGLVEDYARAGQPARLVHTGLTSDVGGIGAFVGDHPPDMLLLNDKPSAGAMKLHGAKWKALGPGGTGPEEHIIAGRAAAIVVNSANKLESLTLGQIKAIFEGEVKDWAVIGGTGLSAPAGLDGKAERIPIHAFGLWARREATKIFEARCLPRRKWQHVKSKKDTTEAVKAVSMDPQAIAYVDLMAIPGLSPASLAGNFAAAGQNVKVLAIKIGIGKKARVIQPTARNIKNAMYLLSRRYFLYVHPRAGDTAKVFEAFITSVLPVDAFRRKGLVPLADAAITRMMKDAMAEAAKKAAAAKRK